MTRFQISAASSQSRVARARSLERKACKVHMLTVTLGRTEMADQTERNWIEAQANLRAEVANARALRMIASLS